MMDTVEIQQILPHRYPFLLIDRIEDLLPGESAVGIKMVTANEPWCQGHFPGDPVMPGVLIAEACAQTAGVIFSTGRDDGDGRTMYLTGMDGMRFRRPVRPGSALRLEVTVSEKRSRMWTFEAVATVDGKRVANGFLNAMVAPVRG